MLAGMSALAQHEDYWSQLGRKLGAHQGLSSSAAFGDPFLPFQDVCQYVKTIKLNRSRIVQPPWPEPGLLSRETSAADKDLAGLWLVVRTRFRRGGGFNRFAP